MQNDRQERGWPSPKSLSLEEMNYSITTFQTVSWGEASTSNVQNGKPGGDKGNGAAKQTWRPELSAALESIAIYRAVTDWWRPAGRKHWTHTLTVYNRNTFCQIDPQHWREAGWEMCVYSEWSESTLSTTKRGYVSFYYWRNKSLQTISNDWKHHHSRHPCG